ncbi:Flavin-dependent thymidylate synthase [Candidatus Lokiarchaeum ossiferum]
MNKLISMEKKGELLQVKNILDHGFVELVDVLGSDQAIVNAARTSYDKGTKKVSSTKQLIRYLMRHQHSGPLEFGELVFRIRCPLFVARQWFRHRTGSYNEVSLRYSEATDEYYVPKSEWITTQDRRNRQARTGTVLNDSELIRDEFDSDANDLLKKYNNYLERGVAREIARINLPLSLYTTFCYKSDLRNLLNFLTLRTDSHAQFEIREYAEAMVEMAEKFFPITIQAWRDYMKNSLHFSFPELNVLKKILSEANIDINEKVLEYFDKNKTPSLAELEKIEFKDKIRTLMGDSISLDYLKKKND